MAAAHSSGLKVGLIIPVFNVEKTIAKVLAGIPQKFFEDISEILVVDNHSSDNTVPVIMGFMNEHPDFASHVTFIQHAENYGYGGSIKAGFEYFINRGMTHAMIFHGDHQVDPAWQIGLLLSIIKDKPQTDLVMSSRFLSESKIENYSLLRTVGNYFFNAVTTLCSGCKMSDAGTAIIVARCDALSRVPFRNLSNTWQFHPQLNILIHKLPNVQVVETTLNWSDSEAGSSVPLIRYGLILLRMLVRYWYKTNVLRQKPEQAFPVDSVRADRRYTVLMQSGKDAPVACGEAVGLSAAR
ncbi:MAG: glycosyltransferase family 2 protein [Bdellovibrionales bacterium]